MTKSGALATAALLAFTARAQTDDPTVASIARDTDNLVVAALASDLSAINRLLELGADPDERLLQKTAFEVAVSQGDIEIVQALLVAGADVNEPCCGGGALFSAARARDLEMVKVLLAAGADLNRRGGVMGNTALMWGISQQSVSNPAPMEIARLLVDAGADVNIENNTGVTALLLAVQRQTSASEAMVTALLTRGAEVDHRRCYSVPDTSGRNQTSYARATGATALGLSSSLGNVVAVRALIAAGADIDLPGCDGKTPLELALESGHAGIVDVLRSATASRLDR